MKKAIHHIVKVITGLTILISVGSLPARAQTGKQQWITQVQQEIARSRNYDEIKRNKIDSLKKDLYKISTPRFFDVLPVFQEYALFNFDSAFAYANQLIEVARLEKNDSMLLAARLKYCQTLLASGMYKSVFDTLESIHPGPYTPALLKEYYELKARSYYDLSDYNKQKVSSQYYTSEASLYIDSILLLSPPHTFDAIYYTSLKHIRNGQLPAAEQGFRELESRPDLTLHQQALLYSTYSDLFLRRGQYDSAIILLCRAAIADIRSSTKETSALLNLSTQLFRQGQIKLASDFIHKAAFDARAYGARQRIIQLSEIMPLIQAENLSVVERDKRGITWYALIITLSCLVLASLGAVIFIQVKKLKKQQKEINSKNLSLHRLVEEKEWLVKEIHHRVKNNLHTINSLLESQSAYLKDEALQAITDSRHRVYAMSLIHQKLYNSEVNVTAIDMQAYLNELVSYLRDGFDNGESYQIKIQSVPLTLDVSLALPIAQIMNEAITNSIKHAFENRHKGYIQVSINPTGPDAWEFRVSDNGKGLPKDFSIGSSPSLGIKLMKGLSEDILADFKISSNDGTIVSIQLSTVRSMKHLAPKNKQQF